MTNIVYKEIIILIMISTCISGQRRHRVLKDLWKEILHKENIIIDMLYLDLVTEIWSTEIG